MQAVCHFIVPLLFFMMFSSFIGMAVTSFLMAGPMLNQGRGKWMTAKELFSKLSPRHRKWYFIFLGTFCGSFLLLIVLAVISS